MPQNLTKMQEEFTQALFAGKKVSVAFREAYPKSKQWTTATLNANASRLASNSKVVARLEQLRAPMARKTLYDALAAHQEAGEAFAGAMEEKQFGAAVAAVQLRAKIHGLITEKREVKVTSFDHIDAAQKMMLIDQLTAIAEERKRLAAPVDVTDIEPKTDAT